MASNNQFKSKLKAYFIKRLGMFDYRHGWMKGNCPSCGKENKFGINLSLNRSNCFVCGYSLKPLEIVHDLENHESLSETIRYLSTNQDYDGIEFKEEKAQLQSRNYNLYLPEGFKILNQGKSQLAKSARGYIKARGFDIDFLSRKGWGYGTKDKTFGYIIIPFHEKGRLIYYNARTFLDMGPRYNNPDKDVTGLGKSFIWYNSDALEMYRTICICEGVFNAETIGERAIASGGKFISKYQINQLIKSQVERVVICLDRDAIDKAVNLAYSLIDFKMVKIVVFPEGKDANDLGRRRTLNLIYNTRYLSKTDLTKLKNKYVKHEGPIYSH